MMRVLVATDAWHPQINDAVRSLEYLASEAPSFGAEIAFLTPNDFRTVPLPGFGDGPLLENISISICGARLWAHWKPPAKNAVPTL